MTTVLVELSVQALSRRIIVLCASSAFAATNTLQALGPGSWRAWRELREWRKTFITWRRSSVAGTLPAAGSAGWLAAFPFGDVAVVRAFGQVEIVFAPLFTRCYLKATRRPRTWRRWSWRQVACC